METVEHWFDNIEERNDFITECYKNNVKYHYFRCNSEGKYRVLTFEPVEETK